MDLDWKSILPVGGLAVLGGLIASSWRTIQGFYQMLASFLVVHYTVDGSLVEAVGHYCNTRFKSSAFGFRRYMGWNVFVRKVGRCQLIALEHATESKLYWNGWIPIWVKSQKSDNRTVARPVDSDHPGMLSITYLRWTIDSDLFIQQVCDAYNEARQSLDPFAASKIRRHFVRIVTGTGDREFVSSTPQPVVPGSEDTSQPSPDGVQWRTTSHRLVGLSIEDVGRELSPDVSSISLLANSGDSAQFVSGVKRWLKSEKWYKDHHVPWRAGFGLTGKPGTGKTSFTRAVAEDFDLPIFNFDLRTLRNSELVEGWSRMLTSTPCIALIEDYDAVFHGRENVTANGALSFDCLINCIDGIRRSDGVLLVVATNHPDSLDTAMVRKGRVDKLINFDGMPEEGVRFLASRILCDYPELIEQATRHCKAIGLTGAEIQDYCRDLALREFEKNSVSVA